jgi:ankyrin repeat protein
MDFLTNSKDTDILILEKLSDRDLLNFCLTNKSINRLCNEDDFWKNRFLKKFGDFQNKSKDISWKKLYLLLVYYIDRYRHLEMVFLAAAGNGDINIVKYLLETQKMGNEINQAMVNAAEGGHIDIVNLMILQGADSFDTAERFAIRSGHTNIVKLITKMKK